MFLNPNNFFEFEDRSSLTQLKFVKGGLITERFSNPPKNSENYSPKEKIVTYLALFLNRCVFFKPLTAFSRNLGQNLQWENVVCPL